MIPKAMTGRETFDVAIRTYRHPQTLCGSVPIPDLLKQLPARDEVTHRTWSNHRLLFTTQCHQWIDLGGSAGWKPSCEDGHTADHEDGDGAGHRINSTEAKELLLDDPGSR